MFRISADCRHPCFFPHFHRHRVILLLVLAWEYFSYWDGISFPFSYCPSYKEYTWPPLWPFDFQSLPFEGVYSSLSFISVLKQGLFWLKESLNVMFHRSFKNHLMALPGFIFFCYEHSKLQIKTTTLARIQEWRGSVEQNWVEAKRAKVMPWMHVNWKEVIISCGMIVIKSFASKHSYFI